MMPTSASSCSLGWGYPVGELDFLFLSSLFSFQPAIPYARAYFFDALCFSFAKDLHTVSTEREIGVNCAQNTGPARTRALLPPVKGNAPQLMARRESTCPSIFLG